MGNSYNLSSKSDMRKFQKDLEKAVMDIAKDYAKDGTFDIECPNCGNTIPVSVGESLCPNCGIVISLDFQE